MSGNKRFADLSKIDFLEYEDIGGLAVNFFYPLNYYKNMEFLGRIPKKEKIEPFSADDFYMFLTKIDKDKYVKKIYKIKKILKMLEVCGILVNEGCSNTSLLGANRFYTIKELTKCQIRNTLYYTEAFGLTYLREKIKNNTVHITGKKEDGSFGNGTGFLIDSKRILTCKHVTTDMTIDEAIRFNNKIYHYEIKKHREKDVALLVLTEKIDGEYVYPSFNNACVLDSVLVLGYPPIPCADDAYMVSQHGEVISVIWDYLNKVQNIVLSSTTRPGNSGGPVLSNGGYLVGMVTQSSHLKESTDEEYSNNNAPYYMAMNGEELYKAIKEIDSDADIYFETYQ